MAKPFIIEKNSRERLQIERSEFKGRRLLSMRVWYLDKDSGEYRPGRDGFAIKEEALPEILAALNSLCRDMQEGRQP